MHERPRTAHAVLLPLALCCAAADAFAVPGAGVAAAQARGACAGLRGLPAPAGTRAWQARGLPPRRRGAAGAAACRRPDAREGGDTPAAGADSLRAPGLRVFGLRYALASGAVLTLSARSAGVLRARGCRNGAGFRICNNVDGEFYAVIESGGKERGARRRDQAGQDAENSACVVRVQHRLRPPEPSPPLSAGTVFVVRRMCISPVRLLPLPPTHLSRRARCASRAACSTLSPHLCMPHSRSPLISSVPPAAALLYAPPKSQARHRCERIAGHSTRRRPCSDRLHSETIARTFENVWHTSVLQCIRYVEGQMRPTYALLLAHSELSPPGTPTRSRSLDSHMHTICTARAQWVWDYAREQGAGGKGH